MSNKNPEIAGAITTPAHVVIVGLGYVGLPLAVAFSRHVGVTGLDIDETRVSELQQGLDHSGELATEELLDSGIEFTVDPSVVADAEFIIVAVPTPVLASFEPDLSYLEAASRMVGQQLGGRTDGLRAPIIVFESTTFPGCTEDVCGPIIEKQSGLVSGEGFLLGYSPERIKFGDREHTLETVVKVTSGQTPEAASVIDRTYSLIATAGTHLAPNIMTAEAAKVIENVQRDLNIGLMNEISYIFDRLGVSTADVLEAATTKWNFLPFRPGLVGGHCIPIDPYYLAYAAKAVGIHPRLILSARETNEQMASFIAGKTVEILAGCQIDPKTASVLVLGLAFKENISDSRNSKALELVMELRTQVGNISVFDPLIPATQFTGIEDTFSGDPFVADARFDAIVVATPHDYFTSDGRDIKSLFKGEGGVLIDVTGRLGAEYMVSDGITYWQP